jgi:hypothetical protein
MALPTFFIIGAPKAGTSSLHFYLDQHPQIQMSEPKEPRYFAGPENGLPYPPDHIAEIGAYEALFDPAVAVRGESSTDYAIHPRRSGAPERIKQAVPEARLVYLVRDPVARTVSHYKMTTALLGERRSLREALGDFSDLHSPYISASLYATQLELYLRHFPAEQILLIDQADLLADRRSTLSQVFSFLSVADAIDEAALDPELLDSGDWRAYPSGYADFVSRVVAPRLRWVPQRPRRWVRRSVERLLWQPVDTSVDAETRAGLEALYTPEVARLRELTGKRFATWSI